MKLECPVHARASLKEKKKTLRQRDSHLLMNYVWRQLESGAKYFASHNSSSANVKTGSIVLRVLHSESQIV